MATVYRTGAEQLNAACIGQQQLILIEGVRILTQTKFIDNIFNISYLMCVPILIGFLFFFSLTFFCVCFVSKESKRSSNAYYGRNDANTKVIIPANVNIFKDFECAQQRVQTPYTMKTIQPGDFIVVDITESNSQVLKGMPLYHSTVSDFNRRQCHNTK